MDAAMSTPIDRLLLLFEAEGSGSPGWRPAQGRGRAFRLRIRLPSGARRVMTRAA